MSSGPASLCSCGVAGAGAQHAHSPGCEIYRTAGPEAETMKDRVRRLAQKHRRSLEMLAPHDGPSPVSPGTPERHPEPVDPELDERLALGLARFYDEMPGVRAIAEAHTMGQPVTTSDIAALPIESRAWYLRHCWNCRKLRTDCECLFP